jgi:hypothetical protein
MKKTLMVMIDFSGGRLSCFVAKVSIRDATKKTPPKMVGGVLM